MMQLQSLISILVLVLLSIAVGTHQQRVKRPINKNPSNSDPELGDKFEGDILGPFPFRGNSGGKLRKIEKWKGGIIPYKIDYGFTKLEKDKILAAIEEYHHKTCISFVPRTWQKDFVRIYRGEGCNSYVGRIGNGQPLSLGKGCFRHGTIVHELMHAIGFSHEHSRKDRNKYVRIMMGNIKKDKQRNYKTYTNPLRIGNIQTKYDYDSVMHYGEYSSFAIDGNKPTIVTLKPMYGRIGQRFALSDNDKLKINVYYNCPKGTTRRTRPPAGNNNTKQ